MLNISENLPLSQVCGLSNVSQSWAVVSDGKKFASNPKDYFARKMHGMIFVVNDQQNAMLAPLIKESLYQLLEAYEDEIADTTDLIAARFKGKPLQVSMTTQTSAQNSVPASENVWFWVVGEMGSNHYHEEILDILDMGCPNVHPLYIGPLDFTKQKFWGLNT